MQGNKASVNFISSLVYILTQFAQAMWITSYIQRYMGVEAYGYIAVIVNLINIAGIMTVSLTSVCSRFMVIELKSSDMDSARKLYSSIQYVTLIMVMISSMFFIALGFNLSSVINISKNYIGQVQILTVFVGLDFIFHLLQVPYQSIFYYESRLYFYYMFMTLSNITRMCTMWLIFNYLAPMIWAGYAGSVAVSCCALCFYMLYKRKKYTQLNFKMHYICKDKIVQLFTSGAWMSLSKLAATLISLSGTYLVNILLGVFLAGIYASITQLQLILSFVTVTIVNIFLPDMLKNYAEGDITALNEYSVSAMGLVSSMLGLIAGGLIIYGVDFMSLWISSQYKDYALLIAVSVFYLPIAYAAEVLNQLAITLNKVKFLSVTSIIFGALNLLMTILLVACFKLGIYGVAFSQCLVLAARAGIVFPIYIARSLNAGVFRFIAAQLKGIVVAVVTALIAYALRKYQIPDTWWKLFINSGVTAVAILFLIFVFDKNQRTFILNFFSVRTQ